MSTQTKTPSVSGQAHCQRTASFKKRFLKQLKDKTRDELAWMLHTLEGELRFMDLLERYDARTVDSVSGQALCQRKEQLEQLEDITSLMLMPDGFPRIAS